jgi:hypothetical protein
MNCPKCGHLQTCPCKACQARNPTEKPWKWLGEWIACGNCDWSAHGDYWQDLEMQEYLRQKEGNG